LSCQSYHPFQFLIDPSPSPNIKAENEIIVGEVASEQIRNEEEEESAVDANPPSEVIASAKSRATALKEAVTKEVLAMETPLAEEEEESAVDVNPPSEVIASAKSRATALKEAVTKEVLAMETPLAEEEEESAVDANPPSEVIASAKSRATALKEAVTKEVLAMETPLAEEEEDETNGSITAPVVEESTGTANEAGDEEASTATEDEAAAVTEPTVVEETSTTQDPLLKETMTKEVLAMVWGMEEDETNGSMTAPAVEESTGTASDEEASTATEESDLVIARKSIKKRVLEPIRSFFSTPRTEPLFTSSTPESKSISRSSMLLSPAMIEARKQPKSPEEESALASKYGQIPGLGDRAYAILQDLGMVQ
jgi:hypothetical protein